MRKTLGFKAGFGLVISVAVSACLNHPDIVREEAAPGEKLSPAEIRQVVIDSPFLTSGDFFLKRSQTDALDFGEMVARGEQTEQRQRDYEERIARLEQAVERKPSGVTRTPPGAAAQAAAAALQLPIKVGLAFDPARVSSADGERLTAALSRAVSGLPVVLVGQQEVEEGLAASRCPKAGLICAAKALGVYPGVRILALFETFELPESVPGEARARISLIDTGLAHRYAAFELNSEISNDDDMLGFAEQAARSALQQAVKRAEAMPWFTRAFSETKERWHISAGQLSGLKAGDELWVMGPGEVVKAPTGAPAGWIPGERKGRLKVEQLFGRDFAACRLLQGKGPQAGDLIMLPGAN